MSAYSKVLTKVFSFALLVKLRRVLFAENQIKIAIITDSHRLVKALTKLLESTWSSCLWIRQTNQLNNGRCKLLMNFIEVIYAGW